MLRKLKERLLGKKSGRKSGDNADPVNRIVTLPMFMSDLDITPVDYHDSDYFSFLNNNLDAICYRFFKESNPDKNTSAFLDAVIEKARNVNNASIAGQHKAHVNTIEEKIAAMRDGDLCYVKNHLERLKADLESINEALRNPASMFHAGSGKKDEEV